MNLITQTYDADQWQLVPKEMDKDMQNDWHDCRSGDMQLRWQSALAAAPQPSNLSLWLSIESAPKDGTKIILSRLNQIGNRETFFAQYVKAETEPCDCDSGTYCEAKGDWFLDEGWYEMIYNWDEFSSVKVYGNEPDLWCEKPQAPEVE